MATEKKKNAKSNGTAPATPKFRFVNYTLNKEDLERLKSLDLDTEFPLELSLDLVMEGYKFSLAYHEQNSTYTASITDRVPGGAFENACLTGRGATALNAWHALAYRHFALSQEDWSFFGDGQDTNTSEYG
jgi:hypothetical protein